jgi:uncharacterized membrane protein affecting hemolysin expression
LCNSSGGELPVTLTPWISRVKQARGELFIAVTVALLVCFSLIRLHAHESAQQADAQALAASLAESLARLAVEPLGKRDRIALGVLANRLVELDAVAGITIYTVADEMLAIAGVRQGGMHRTEPVIQDDNIIGYVRVSLITPGAESAAREFWLSLAIALAIPLLVVGVRNLPWQQLRQLTAGRAVSTAPLPVIAEPAAQKPVACGMLAVNLFNQLTLKPDQRNEELEHASSVANTVADLYAATVDPLPGTGLLLRFDGTGEDERNFQIVCAAVLLAKLLNDPQSPGQYRLGMHTVTLPANQQAPTDLLEVQDASLLSAVAKPHTIAVSGALFNSIPRSERLQAQPMDNPLLNQLESTDPEAWLVSGLAEPHQTLIDNQARELGYSSDPATPSESTF